MEGNLRLYRCILRGCALGVVANSNSSLHVKPLHMTMAWPRLRTFTDTLAQKTHFKRYGYTLRAKQWTTRFSYDAITHFDI